MTHSVLKKFIMERCIARSADGQKIITSNGSEGTWLLDLRPLLLNSETLQFVASEFWNAFEPHYPFQVSCRELTGVPLLGAIIAEGSRREKPISGVIVRKSRKKTGLQKFVEGELSELPIILIDDLVNGGESFQRQILALGDKSPLIKGYFTIVRYRDAASYHFISKDSRLYSLFNLEEFGLSLKERDVLPVNSDLFDIVWTFESPEPNHRLVLPKSGPAIDSERVYFGSDSGYFWALDQRTGAPVWKYRTGNVIRGKRIFSTPTIHDGVIYFGAYDGNFYALDTHTGAPVWIARDADSIGASPAIAKNLGLVFIGNEYGLFQKKGGAAAYKLNSGEKIWENRFSAEFTHCSPEYSQKYQAVAIGSNDQFLYLLDAKNGETRWRFQAGGDIKGRPAFDEKRGLVLFGASDGLLYVLNSSNGALMSTFKTEGLVYARPVVFGNYAFIASEDRNLYSINLENGKLEWTFTAAGRIMASPLIESGRIYIGANDGRFYELDMSGKLLGYTQFLERITNQAVYNQNSETFFITTNANQLFALKKKNMMRP